MTLGKSKKTYWVFLAGSVVFLSLPFVGRGGPSLLAEDQRWRDLADGTNNLLSVRWEEAYQDLIAVPDGARLERGEILGRMKEKGEGILLAQTRGLIRAAPEDCFDVITDYQRYRKIMPYTKESRVIRSFFLEGEPKGIRAVDFWTRVRVLGFDTRYLIRIAHLAEPENRRFRSYWTLVNRPEEVSFCRDENERPCMNDLKVNVGSHLFEPYAGDPRWTVHTYTLKIAAEGHLRGSALRWVGLSSMKEVTRALRRVLEQRCLPASGKGRRTPGEG